MDKIRIVLIALIAIVSFYGVIEFGKFRQTNDKAAIVELHKAPASFDSMPTLKNKEAHDLPEMQHAHDVVEKTNINQKQLISIQTDDFDIQIDKDGGDIVYLALRKQSAQLDTPNSPFVLLQESTNHTYIASSGLIGDNGTDTASGRALFTSASNHYQLAKGNDKLVVDLSYQQKNHVSITKRFTFHRDSYLIDVEYIINNQSAAPWKGSFYAQIKRDGSKPVSETSGMGMSPYLGFATRTHDDRFKKVSFSDIEEKPFTSQLQGGWVAMLQHYFLSAWVFNANKLTDYKLFNSSTSQLNIARGVEKITVIEPGQTGVIKARFYSGPKDQYQLAKISEGLDLSVDYGFLWMIAQPLYALLFFFNNGVLHMFGHSYDIFPGVGNWGFSIILLTLLVKLCFYSLNVKAYTSMAKMRAIQPKMLALKERYGDDRQKLSQATMALYKTEGVNPIGGCLPMIVQMPVFISLYWVLMESVELRHAPFIFWIKDLSAMDPYFILPLIMGISMFIQQKLQPAPPDPLQAKVMQFLPVIFTFFFLFFPAGLVLYWVVNNIITILQQWYITRRIEAKGIK